MFTLRQFQKDALAALQHSAHVICIAPTGSGKSLIYEKTAAKPGTRTLLVTPLVALARQQAQRLEAAGIRTCLGAGASEERKHTRQPTEDTEAWIVSPEMLQYQTHEEFIRKWRPNFLVVDECHCLWEWGEDFRPAFAHLPSLLHSYPITRSLWLTATLPLAARDALRSNLPDPIIEIGKFDLPADLHLACIRVPWVYRTDLLVRWIRTQSEAGIVFATTREMTERLSRLLGALGKRVAFYHAGMSREERRATEHLIDQKKADVVIATSAFGMGMDHGHLKWAILWQVPTSLLSLAQAIGRAGRKGGGQALVFWDHDDFRLLEWTVRNSPRRKQDLLDTLSFLKKPNCRKSALAQYFDNEPATEPCGEFCDHCSPASWLKKLNEVDHTGSYGSPITRVTF